MWRAGRPAYARCGPGTRIVAYSSDGAETETVHFPTATGFHPVNRRCCWTIATAGGSRTRRKRKGVLPWPLVKPPVPKFCRICVYTPGSPRWDIIPLTLGHNRPYTSAACASRSPSIRRRTSINSATRCQLLPSPRGMYGSGAAKLVNRIGIVRRSPLVVRNRTRSAPYPCPADLIE